MTMQLKAFGNTYIYGYIVNNNDDCCLILNAYVEIVVKINIKLHINCLDNILRINCFKRQFMRNSLLVSSFYGTVKIMRFWTRNAACIYFRPHSPDTDSPILTQGLGFRQCCQNLARRSYVTKNSHRNKNCFTSKRCLCCNKETVSNS